MNSPSNHPAPGHPSAPRHADTLAVHAGRETFGALGVHAPPIDLSSTYPVGDLTAGIASIDALVAGGEPLGSAIYSRLHNPTVAHAEQAIAALEGAVATAAFASGMAAYTAALLVARQRGGHVVAVRPLYGSADHLLASGMLGLRVTFTTPDRVAAACEADTALVLIETPANPTLQLVDIADVVRQADGVPVMVDATFATPILLQPLAHGATLVLHSATKALAGHGDVLAGVISTNDDAWLRALRQVRLLTGSVLHPLAAYLLHRGLATLPLRVERAQRNAIDIAERLAAAPGRARRALSGHGRHRPARRAGARTQGPRQHARVRARERRPAGTRPAARGAHAHHAGRVARLHRHAHPASGQPHPPRRRSRRACGAWHQRAAAAAERGRGARGRHHGRPRARPAGGRAGQRLSRAG